MNHAHHPDVQEDDEGYYAAVERHFVALRGSPLFVSPSEWQLIDRWRQQQIPLRVVKQGLDRVFERSRPNRPIRRLSYCRQTVEAHYRRFREAVAGSPSVDERNGTDPTDVQAYFSRLKGELARAAEKVDAARQPLVNAIDDAVRRLEALASEHSRPANGMGLDEIERELDAVEESLLETAESVLPPEDRQRCSDEAERSLRDYRARMPSDVFESASRAAYLKRVRSIFGLPPLSLFYL
jgi:hypothetical protein